MATTKCGQMFSWDSPMWCRAKDDEMCANCPLNIKLKERNGILDEEEN